MRGGADDVLAERIWLPRLAPHLPMAIPELLGEGEPVEGYPWPWSVYRWPAGENPEAGALSEPVLLAGDLARFVAAMRSITLPGAPQAHRGGPVASLDAGTRAARRPLPWLVRYGRRSGELSPYGGAVPRKARRYAWGARPTQRTK